MRVTPHAVTPVVRANPDDDHVIACAVAARANATVSGNRHQLDLGQNQGIAALTASAAIERIAASREM